MIKTVKTLIILSSPFTEYEMPPQFGQARFLLSYVCSSKGWRTVHHTLPSLSLNNDTILCAPVRLGHCHSRSHHCPISPRISHPLAPPFITYLSHKSSSHVFRSFDNNPVPDNNHLISFVSEELLNLDTTVPNICEEPESSVTGYSQHPNSVYPMKKTDPNLPFHATVLLGKISPTPFSRYYFNHKHLLPITIFF